jgi:hypothetical protein
MPRLDIDGLDMDLPHYKWGRETMDELNRRMLPSLMEVAPISILTDAQRRLDLMREAGRDTSVSPMRRLFRMMMFRRKV